MLPILIYCLIIGITESRIKPGSQTKPPEPKYGFDKNHNTFKINDEVATAIDEWDSNNDNNVWELSGLTEGDIMFYEDHHHDHRNGLLDDSGRWTNSTIPFYIDETDFTDSQVSTILKAINEYHTKTCVRFRPYKKEDENFVVIKGNATGCWSSVGMQTKGQVVHLQTPGCVSHGVIVHELLHALGFYHQQSASERDEYVKINWENIIKGTEHNFNKYNSSVVTSYNVTYDYSSVMHYSEKAFSKNGNPTIESLAGDAKLGQRRGLSEKDIIKLNKMYEPLFCHPITETQNSFDPFGALLEWFETVLLFE